MSTITRLNQIVVGFRRYRLDAFAGKAQGVVQIVVQDLGAGGGRKRKRLVGTGNYVTLPPKKAPVPIAARAAPPVPIRYTPAHEQELINLLRLDALKRDLLEQRRAQEAQARLQQQALEALGVNVEMLRSNMLDQIETELLLLALVA